MTKKLSAKNKPAIYLILSAVAGIAIWFVGEKLYEILTKKLYTPLGILLYFLVAFVIISALLIILLIKKMPASDFKSKMRSVWKLLLIFLLIFLFITGLFEFLYEIGETEIPEPTSLIFLIDDSGSMSGNEADRVKALNDVMKNSSLPFSVYSFSSDAKQLIKMGTYRNELTEADLAFSSKGITDIIGSINDVLRDLESGTINNAGLSPKILLVSDGGSSSFGLRSMARACRKHMVSISSIGMRGCSESLLQKIADSTGGVYVSCTDISALGADLTKAVASDTDRNLLSERIVYKNDGLYGFLRILFLSLAGLLWSVMKTMLISEEKKSGRTAFTFSVLSCFAGVLILEFGTAAGMSAVFLRLIFDVLWAMTYGSLPSKKSVVIAEGGSDIPIFSKGQIKVNQISSEKASAENLKQIGVKPTSENSSLFKGGNNGAGIFGNENAFAQKNSGLFGNNIGNGNNSGRFGKNAGNDGKPKFFDKK